MFVELLLVERATNRADASIHHVARRDDVRAGRRVRERRAREQLERRIVVDLAVAQNSAVSVIGVLAHAHVGDHDELRKLFLERAHRVRHGTFVVPRRRAGWRPCCREGRRESRRPRLPRSPRRASRSISSTESWKTPGIEPTGLRIFAPERTNSGSTSCDGREVRLLDEAAQRLGAAQPARAVFGKRRHCANG